MSYWDKFASVYNIFAKKYDFHFCNIGEIGRIVDFIDKYWKKGHILTKSRELMDFQYLDKEHNRYNFVIAEDKDTNEIHAIIGFIMSSIYDEDIKYPIRWGAIWKVRNDVAPKGLGIAVKYYFEKYAHAPYVGGLGLSNYSKTIDRKLGENVGKLHKYYMLNDEITDFKLADNVTENSYAKNICSTETKSIRRIDSGVFRDETRDYYKYVPEYKSVKYYINRYRNHPIYHYDFYEIYDEDKAIALFITRTATANHSKGIFIVDYIGSGLELDSLYNDFQRMMKNEGAEFICFYETGLYEAGMINSGFIENSETIVPLYFEPLARVNVDLDYHYISERNNEHLVVFKGDADQDRPNIL